MCNYLGAQGTQVGGTTHSSLDLEYRLHFLRLGWWGRLPPAEVQNIKPQIV
ncbi:MAG: hypothetical protein AAF741_18650 [Bacteroidota bacterium]